MYEIVLRFLGLYKQPTVDSIVEDIARKSQQLKVVAEVQQATATRHRLLMSAAATEGERARSVSSKLEALIA